MSAPSEHRREADGRRAINAFFDKIPLCFQRYPEFLRHVEECIPDMTPQQRADVAGLIEKAYWLGGVNAAR